MYSTVQYIYYQEFYELEEVLAELSRGLHYPTVGTLLLNTLRNVSPYILYLLLLASGQKRFYRAVFFLPIAHSLTSMPTG
jgi:hypothetical protein